MKCEQMVDLLLKMDPVSVLELLLSLYEQHNGTSAYLVENFTISTSVSGVCLQVIWCDAREPLSLVSVYPTRVLITTESMGAVDGFDLLNQGISSYLRRQKVKKVLHDAQTR